MTGKGLPKNQIPVAGKHNPVEARHQTVIPLTTFSTITLPEMTLRHKVLTITPCKNSSTNVF